MRKLYLPLMSALLILFIGGATLASDTPQLSGASTSTLYQTDPIQRLINGGYSEGNTRLSELVELGDFGLGTFENYRGGEMLILGGLIYSIPHPEASVVVKNLKAKTPFAMVTGFRSTNSLVVQNVENFAALQKILDQHLDPNKNYAISVEGKFGELAVQCVQPPSRPGLPLDQVGQQKAQFKNIKAQWVGFRMGPGAAAVNHPGYYHFHGRTAEGGGGHVLDMKKMESGEVRWQEGGLQILHP